MSQDDSQQFGSLKMQLREALASHEILPRELRRLALEQLIDELVITDTERHEAVKYAARCLLLIAHRLRSEGKYPRADQLLKVAVWLERNEGSVKLP